MVISVDIQMAAVVAWDNFNWSLQTSGTVLAHDEYQEQMIEAVKEHLKNQFGAEVSNIRPVITERIGEEYETIYGLKLEYVQSVVIV